MFINKNKNILVQQLKFSFTIFLLFHYYYKEESIEAFYLQHAVRAHTHTQTYDQLQMSIRSDTKYINLQNNYNC